MGGFFQALAANLAERWLTLLLIPGALFTAAFWVGVQLKFAHALNWGILKQRADSSGAALARQTTGTQAILLVAVLLVAAGIGLAVQALTAVTRLTWLGQWPRIADPVNRWCVAKRRARWHQRLNQRREQERDHPADVRTPDQQRLINAAAERVNRIAPAEPGRPTWMGDRIHGVEQVALNRYGLDLTYVWPRLWLVLPDPTRAEITAANAAFALAVANASWAWPYLILGALWWPAALIGIGIGISGWVRARSGVTDLAALSESALDLHGRSLAIALGIVDKDSIGPLTVPEGRKLTAFSRKGR